MIYAINDNNTVCKYAGRNRIMARFVLGSAILGLICSSLPSTANRCNSVPCSCDSYGRLNCDCNDSTEELILSSEGNHKLSAQTIKILIENCRTVRVSSSTFVKMNNLRSIKFQNIGNLSLVQQSLEISREISVETRISISNTSIDMLPSSVFCGNIKTISLQNVWVRQVQAFAFSNINKTETIEIKDCRIDLLEAQAFKKFDVAHFYIIDSSLGGVVPSKFMNDIRVYANFMLDGCAISTIRSLAFIIKGPKTVVIQNCFIDNLEGEAFDVSAQDTVIMQNNTFRNVAIGAFFGIKADRENSPANSDTDVYDFKFNDNKVANFEEGSFYFDQTSFRVHMSNLLISQLCDCDKIPIWRNNILNDTNIQSKLYSGQTSSTSIVSHKDPETLYCLNGSDDEAPSVSIAHFQAQNCALGKSILILALGLASFTLLLLIIGIILTAYCCRRKKIDNAKQRWISVPTNVSEMPAKNNGVIAKDRTTASESLDNKITMVVPDGRLYKETEFHIIVEKAQPLTTEL